MCGGVNTLGFLRRGQVPVHQNLVMPDPVHATEALRGVLDMVVCEDCGFVFNRAFDPARLSYGQDYDNTQSHSEFFDAYLDLLVEGMVKLHGVRDARVVEVGCGKGHFLRKLVEYPGASNHGFGFDPSYVGPDSDLDGRLKFRRCFYDAACADVPADVVVCRHVIEHVQDPLGLLRAVHAALAHSPQARVFFETPCVEWILQNRVVWDLFYEHCSLFSRASLRLAFERTGFIVEDVTHVFGGQYLWLEARLAPSQRPAVRLTGHKTALLAHDFGMDEHALLQEWSERLAELKLEGRLALWGAGAKGVTFANLVDPDCATIDCLVDVNPHKQGCFVPGTGHAIVGPQALVERGVQNVILMNPNYRQENLQLLQAVGCAANLLDWSEA
ncbi:MAG: class I SAM-dependent methyltransferase [Burkholderiaceae bacterium]